MNPIRLLPRTSCAALVVVPMLGIAACDPGDPASAGEATQAVSSAGPPDSPPDGLPDGPPARPDAARDPADAAPASDAASADVDNRAARRSDEAGERRRSDADREARAERAAAARRERAAAAQREAMARRRQASRDRAADAPSAVEGFTSLPSTWFYPRRSAALRRLEGRPAPELALKDWVGEPVDLAEVAADGKIVVIDFWGTWCGPCRRALPKNAKLAKQYADEVVFLGVHDSSRGWQSMERVAKEADVAYPLAVDDDQRSERAWRVGFWPTYFIVDTEGIVRAAGLNPAFLEAAIKAVLTGEVPDEVQLARTTRSGIPIPWLEGTRLERVPLTPLYLQPPVPDLTTEVWANSEPKKLGEIDAEAILLVFFDAGDETTPESIQAINGLRERYSDEPLAIIGVANVDSADAIDDLVEAHGIAFPVCADVDGSLAEQYAVTGSPDYYFVTNERTTLVADIRDEKVEDALRVLLKLDE